MHDLWLGCEGDVLHLEGASIQPPLKGCSYRPGAGEGETARDELTLSLESTAPSDIDMVLAGLERHLAAARIYRERGLGQPVWLGMQPLAADDTWRARVYSGYLESTGSGPADRTRGRVQVRLVLTRRNYFEGGLVELPLSNRNGTRVTGGLALVNHADNGHDNHVLIDGVDLAGEQALPAGLRLIATNTGNGNELRHLVVGLNVHSNPAGFNPVFEAESGTGGTSMASAECSGGSYKLLAWSGSGEAELLTWLMSAGRCADAAGNTFRFILRLAQVVGYSDLWLKLRVRGGEAEAILGETDWALVCSGDSLQELGPLPLPPGALPPGEPGMPLQLVLVARRFSSGSHALALDSLALVTLDGYRRYRAIAGLPQNGQLVDDPPGEVAAYQPGLGWLASHQAVGEPLTLLPGKTQRLTFFQDEVGGLAPITRSLSVQAWYRPRRRLL